MATNLTPQYQKAEEEYHAARTYQDKVTALNKMLQTIPKHKGTENMQQQIKQRLAKLKEQQEKQKAQKKGKHGFALKREGDALVVLVGPTNSGKSTLLNQLTGTHAEVAAYPFTTKMPEIGVMDYHGVKIQVVEIPALVEGYAQMKMGPTFLSVIKQSDLIVLLFHTAEEKMMLNKELLDVDRPRLIYNHQEHFPDLIWRHLSLVKIFTKQPGKKKETRPLALKKGAMVKDVASIVHKDFLKHFRFARIYGNNAKFEGQMVGLDYVLQDDDVVELHLD
jgi:ribosome-interacting GTPase 1